MKLEYIEILTKSANTWDNEFNCFAPEAAARRLIKFINTLGGIYADFPEVAATRSAYFAVYDEETDDELFEIRCSDHTKPTFNQVGKYSKSEIRASFDGRFYVSGVSVAKNIIKEFIGERI